MISKQLFEQGVRHQVFLERLKTGEVNQYASFLKDIDKSIRSRLSGEITAFTRNRLERLIKAIESDLSAIYSNYWDELRGNLIDLADYESGFEARSLDQALDNFESVIPSQSQVMAAVFSKPLSVRGADGGKLLEPFIKDWSNAEIKRFSGAVRQGFFEGQTTSQMLQTIRGTRANKYKDGLLAITNRDAEAVVRTAVQHVASIARQETWDKNPKIVKGVRWVSTLDGRTTQICRSLDGNVFPRDSGPRPPIHIRCRSTTIAELDGKFAFLKKGATRSSKDGPVDADMSYYDWLKTQSTEFQSQAIGPIRAKLLRDGGLTAERFAELNLGKQFQPLTLNDMRKLEPLAFEKAGI